MALDRLCVEGGIGQPIPIPVLFTEVGSSHLVSNHFCFYPPFVVIVYGLPRTVWTAKYWFSPSASTLFVTWHRQCLGRFAAARRRGTQE